MIVTIDGPAGAGKSSTARTLAARLGFRFLDTGAMYRAVAWAAVNESLGFDDPAKLIALAHRIVLDVTEDAVSVNGTDVTAAIRTSEITGLTHHAANNPGVRAHLVELQRRLAKMENFVTEGRDQGTIVFPHAECKIFLTASPKERARRRALDLQKRGEQVSVETVLAEQAVRDQRDSTRAVGPLRQADDAIEFATDGLSREQVIDGLERLVRARMRQVGSALV